MARTLATLATTVGGLTAVVATTGMCLAVGIGNTPSPTSITVFVAAVVVLVVGLVRDFEHQSLAWAEQVEAQAQARRNNLQTPRTPSGPATHMR